MPDYAPFDGFDAPRYTPTPDRLFDELLAPGRLTDPELRVLLYLVRRTFGFKKDADAVSLGQFVNGIITGDGRRLDWGAGVSRASAVRAVQGLVAKGIILAEHHTSAAHGHEATIYRLRMRGTPLAQGETSLVSERAQGSLSPGLPLVSAVAPQETVQETVNKNGSEPDLSARRRAFAAVYSSARYPARQRAALQAAWEAAGAPDPRAWLAAQVAR